MTKKQKKMLYRILAAAVLFLAAKLIPLPMLVSAALYFAAYLTVGCDILRKAWKGICNRQVFDENFLMAVATVGAIALALYERSGDYSEAVAVMLFYQIGELFQSYAVGKSRRSITALMDIRPDYANIERDGKLEQVDPDAVAVGTVITVQPGEKVPIDGVVEDGVSTLNTAALTGESLPRDVSAGDEIISGCINMTGVLKVRTTKAFGESTVSKILELMENSSSHKSRSESFISRFAKVYTPAVCYSALALAILPPLVLTVSGADADWGTWVYRALTFLVISCPCALVISIPLSFFAGLRRRGQGRRAHQGLQLPRGPLPDEDRRIRQDRHAHAGRFRGQRRASQPDGAGKAARIRGRLPSARPRTPSARACKRLPAVRWTAPASRTFRSTAAAA